MQLLMHRGNSCSWALGLLLLLLPWTGCRSFHSVPLAEPDFQRPQPGAEVRVLTLEGERFHAVVESFDGGVLTVRDKRYGYQDTPLDRRHRNRTTYRLAEISRMDIAGSEELGETWTRAAVMTLAVVGVLFLLAAPDRD